MSDDSLACRETELFNCVCDLASFVVVYCLQDRHRAQEVLILVTLVLCGIFHDVIEGVTVQLPECHGALGNDRGGSWRIVEQGQLTEGVTLLVVLD